MNRSVSRSFLALVVAALSLGTSEIAAAAPCCAANSVIPSLITGDDRAQLAASFSSGSVIGDAPSQGLPVFRADDDRESTRVFRLDGAMLISDRWQVGASFPVIDRSVSRGSIHEHEQGPGDVEFSVGHEFLPEWTYSEWKPRGHLFLGLTAPTGKSIYESALPGQADATGRGVYRVQTGVVLTKRWMIWDAHLIGAFHHSFPRTFDASVNYPDGNRVNLGSGGSVSLGGGYSPSGGNFRAGLRLQPSWGAGRKVDTGNLRYDSKHVQVIDTSLELTYLITERDAGTWTAFASYVDQTLFGPARNTTLSRIVAVGLQKRWDR